MQAPRPDIRSLVSTYFDPANHARLSAVIPALAGPFYMVGHSRRVCENTMFVDWGLPGSRKSFEMIRHVERMEHLAGIEGEGKVLWRCYGFWNVPGYLDLQNYARLRGFEIRDAIEFHTWLKQHTQNCLRLPATAGLPALEASLHKLLSQNPTQAAMPAEKAR